MGVGITEYREQCQCTQIYFWLLIGLMCPVYFCCASLQNVAWIAVEGGDNYSQFLWCPTHDVTGVLKLCQQLLSIYSHSRLFHSHFYLPLYSFRYFSRSWKCPMLVQKCLVTFGPPCTSTEDVRSNIYFDIFPLDNFHTRDSETNEIVCKRRSSQP